MKEELRGTRTTFSIFGSIALLNGVLFPGATVEAVTDESVSEFNGSQQKNCRRGNGGGAVAEGDFGNTSFVAPALEEFHY